LCREDGIRKEEGMKKIIICVFIFAIMCGISFGVTAGVIKALSFCFGFIFTWKLALGVWIILWVLTALFKGRER